MRLKVVIKGDLSCHDYLAILQPLKQELYVSELSDLGSSLVHLWGQGLYGWDWRQANLVPNDCAG